MQRRSRPTRPSLLALSLGVLTSAPATLRGQSVTVAGMWRISPESSQAVDPGIPEGAGGGFGEGRGPGGGEPRTAGRAGGPRMRPNRGTGSPQLLAYMRPVLQLLIRQDDSSVALSDASGQMESFRTDGRKVKETMLDGSETETSARWKEGWLTIERKFRGAGTVRESYTIDPLSHRLVVEVRLSGGNLPRAIELRRLYDPANGS